MKFRVRTIILIVVKCAQSEGVVLSFNWFNNCVMSFLILTKSRTVVEITWDDPTILTIYTYIPHTVFTARLRLSHSPTLNFPSPRVLSSSWNSYQYTWKGSKAPWSHTLSKLPPEMQKFPCRKFATERKDTKIKL